jgi:hypothetical protein
LPLLALALPAQMPAAAAGAPAIPPIGYSDDENYRMDAEVNGLEEPLLKWYRAVRYAPAHY